MSDEETKPDTSAAAAIPQRLSDRMALFVLTSSFGINVAFWGSLIYWHWKSDSAYMAVGRTAVFVAAMAGVHFIGYRLWRQQFVQDQSSSNEPPARPFSLTYWPPIKTTLLQQGIILILALLVLDMGQTICEAITAVLAHWLAIGIILARRPSSPTPIDIFVIRYGFLIMFFSAVVILPYVAMALGRW